MIFTDRPSTPSTMATPRSLEKGALNGMVVPFCLATPFSSHVQANLLRSSPSSTTEPMKAEKTEQVLHEKQDSLSSHPKEVASVRSTPFERSGHQAIATADQALNIRVDFSGETWGGTISCTDHHFQLDDRNQKENNQDPENNNSVSTEIQMLDPQANIEGNTQVYNSPALSLASCESRYAMFFSTTKAVVDSLETISAGERSVGTTDDQAVRCPWSNNNNGISAKRFSVKLDNNDDAVSQQAANPDSLSLVNTATTTTTTLSGTPVPAVIYLLQRSNVPLDEPLDMLDEVRRLVLSSDQKTSTSKTIFQRLRVRLRQNHNQQQHQQQLNNVLAKDLYLSEFDKEAFERTLVQI